jgi:NAD(P)-dependent dehydrogenase (short-subunit alcohol dehydrogenase family)
MQQSRHVGKLVIAIDDGELQPVIAAGHGRNDATYLISGGLGGFGLATARWLAKKGARHFALIGRGGAATDEARAARAALEAAGAAVRVFRRHIGPNCTRQWLSVFQKECQPFAAIVHAAMVLDDGAIVICDRAYARVMAPKVEGAWDLHLATRCPLDFSSCIPRLERRRAPGQGGYVAKTVSEALAEYRRGRVCGLALVWGRSPMWVTTRNPQ